MELRDFEQLPLVSEELAVAVPIQWRNEIRDGVWDDLVSRPWVYSTSHCAFHQQIEEELKKRDLIFSSHVKCDGNDMRYELISNGMGIGILEARNARKLELEEKAFIWKSDTYLSVDLNYVFLKRRAEESGIKSAAEAVRELWKIDPKA